MAQTVKLKRSATGGAVPTTAQLELGEVAINTFDGKMFLKKDDGTEAVVEVTGGLRDVVEDTTPQLGGDLDLNSNSITGTGGIAITGEVNASQVQLSGGTGDQGTFVWNADAGTADLTLLNDSVLQVGQEVLYLVKNQTGVTIPNGTAVMATGTLGASGRLTVAPMLADGSVEAKFFLGITTNEIVDGGDGYVTYFGMVRGVDLTSFADGDILWLDPNNDGQFVSTEPTDIGDLKLAVAFVVYAGNGNPSNGMLQVRFSEGTHLHEAHDVYFSNLADGDLLKYNSASSVWLNYPSSNFLTEEVDPIFSASASFGITETQVTNWDAAFSWGDHAESGYLTAETQTLQNVTDLGATTTTNIEAASFVTTSGTSSQFVKGDGSLDSSTYLTSYTETQTLQDVTDLGATTTANVTVGTLHSDFYTYKTDYPVLSKPTYAEGKVFYDPEYKTLSLYNEISDMTLQLGQEFVVRAYNGTGSTISNGTPCRYVGVNGEVPSVAPADATTENNARVLGIATHDIPDGTVGYLTRSGLVSGIDTSGIAAGSPIHLGADGSLQTSAPTYPYFPTEVGICLISDVTDGYIFVKLQEQSFEQIRVSQNGHIEGNFTINGDLIVNGTQSITSQQNLAINDSFIYLNSGDNIGDAGTTFTGSGLDDAYFTGYYEGSASQTYYVRIDSVGGGTGGVDTFEWSLDNFSTTEATGVDITGERQALVDNISIFFNATTGHTLNDVWSGTAVPINIDTGWVTNRNTGTSGIGYTHMGVFFDVTDNRFKFFDEYLPEPTGTIDVNDVTFSFGDIQANSFIGDLVGNADTATTADEATTLTSLTATITELNYSSGVTSSIQTQINSKIGNVVEDTTPQLGGTLDANGQDIDMGTNTITDTKVGQWDTAYSWGDHGAQGYLTTETVYADSPTKITVGTTAPTSPSVGDLWVDTN